MFSKVKLYEQRYLKMNEERISRSIGLMNENGRKIFDLVPLLLHFNHTALPCFIDGDVPHGIINFELSLNQRQIIEELSSYTNSVNYLEIKELSILALYCMGSTSSVGQGPMSDIDYWVCVSSHMSVTKIKLLEKKCIAITNMAKNIYKMDINFFIVKETKFTEPVDEIVDTENCGSAQHLFLLDEFYRSAIYIAGQKLLWMIVPSEHENNYEEYVKELFLNNVIKRNDWIDFGSVSNIPAGEYYGSALWLLYKGTDAPFKAVIKILLMEAYSQEYPKTLLVSSIIKNYMQEHDVYNENLDSYFMVYKKIYNYLKTKLDDQRIELLNYCFYKKISDGLQKIEDPNSASYKRIFVNKMLKKWGWNLDYVEKLNKRKDFLAIQETYKVIFNALMQSYKMLLTFGVSNQISDTINFQDMSVLSRKLYAIFDEHIGKINLYSMEKLYSTYESNITIIHVDNSVSCKNGWYVFKQLLEPKLMIGAKPINYYPNLVSALVSLYFNGIVSPKTNIVFNKNSFNLTSLTHNFIVDLESVFSKYKKHLTNDLLLMPAYINKIAIFVNFTKDNTDNSYFSHIAKNTTNINVFSFGNTNISLVSSISVVLTNSWNEIICRNYEGENSIIEFINELDSYFGAGVDINGVINCFVYSAHLQGIIHQQFLDLVNNCFRNIKHKNNDIVPIKINGIDYSIVFNNRKLRLVKESNLTKKFDDNVDIPYIIEEKCMYGCHQYFFVKENGNEYTIFEVDKYQNILIHHNFDGSIQNLIQDINAHYSKLIDEELDINIKFKQYFNLPQFFEANIEKNEVVPLII